MHMREQLSVAAFAAGFEALLGNAPAGLLRQHHLVKIPSDRKPWIDTGIDLGAGEKVTTFGAGTTFLTGTGLSFGADFQLWCRIGPEGEIFRGTRASNTFTVGAPGRLYVASYFPGEWATRKGELATPDEVYGAVTGELAMLILRWQTDPLDGLKMLVSIGDVGGLVAGEIDRLNKPVPAPDGWNYLWFIGPAETYSACQASEHANAICCHSQNNAALLIKDVALPLAPGTRLRWSWRMEELPSKTREDTLPTHDYLSIAVEFDNGQDITYVWSSELPVDTGFRCPIPTWTARETHVVARSGQDGLGQWFKEERDVYRDYEAKIGGPLPANIIRVWLIAVSLFQHTEGKCQYADISFLTDSGAVRVL
jgi:hypothetical protein